MSSTLSGDEAAQFFGFLGAAAALVFSCMGAAYGTAKSGVGVASMAGVLGICGLIIAVIVSIGINAKAMLYYLFDGCGRLSSGLACGLDAGMAIGILGDAGVSPQHMGEYLCSMALFSSLRKMSVPIRR